MLRIAKVTPKDHYLLEVFLSNGTTVILNMAARLDSIRFMDLRDKAFFDTVSTDGRCVRWGGQIEVPLSEVFHLAQK